MKVKINGKNCTFFTEGSIQLKLDSIASVFSFKTRFNPENDDHKELFKPLQYYKTEIFNDANKLSFTGTILNHSFQSDPNINLLVLSGYSLSGILEDVVIPVSEYPLESNNRSLKDIATRLCGFYGIGLYIDDSVKNEVNAIFKKTTASATDTIKDYLSRLTSQKNIVLSHNAKGQVVLFKPSDNQKIRYFFNKGNSLSMTANYNGQAMHSHIACVRQPSQDNAGVSTVDSIQNPLIKTYRPTTKILSSGEDTDTRKAADNELASELKAIAITVNLKGLFDDIYPGEIVNVHNHEIYSFAYSRYMVSDVTLNFNEKSNTTTLNLVLPETYTGQLPKDILFAYKSHKTDI